MKKKVKKTAKYNPCHILCHPSTWIAVVLLLALLVVYGVSMYGFRAIGPKTELEAAKLAVVDDVLRDYIERYEVVDSGSYQQMTGYGISDEDNVFYVTFDYIRYDDENHTVKHGIMYFWPSEDGGYGRAFSYHDDNYHPGGEYVKTSDGIDQETVNLAPEGWWPSAKE